MTVMITHCSRSQARQIRRFRRDGFTLKSTAEAMGMSPNRVSRYERILDLYGLSVFASKSPAERARAEMRRAGQ